MKLIVNICLLMLLIFLDGCNSNKGLVKVYSIDACPSSSRAITFKSLLDSSSLYDGSIVEVTGYYRWGLEESAISSSEYNTPAMIWTDFSPGVADKVVSKSQKGFEKMQGKKIKVRGTFYAGKNGHLAQYPGAIKYICYLEVEN